MRPSTVLRLYCAASFIAGSIVTAVLAALVHQGEIDMNASAILTLCLNVLLLMILPLVLDWSERKYFKARFVQLEELAQTNPELKTALEQQCSKLSLPGLRLAAVDSPVSETFSYGLWRQNPRLIVPASWLQTSPSANNVVPSIEVELNRFASRDVSFVFIAFFIAQVAVQYLVLTQLWH